MLTSAISSFLGRGLIELGGDDAKLEKIITASGDLLESLKSSPHLLINYSISAFDPYVSGTDPAISSAIEALAGRWPTYVNTFSDIPIVVARAMLLDAVAQASREDHYIAIGFTSLARNHLPLATSTHEQEVWTSIVLELESNLNRRAELEWSTPENIEFAAFQIGEFSSIEIGLDSPAIDKKGLRTKLYAAAGPNGTAGATNGNPYWPQNNPQQWVTEFGNRLGDAISEVVEEAISSSSPEPIDLDGHFQTFSQAISSYLSSSLNAVVLATAGLQRRTNLLWWKESLYSTSAGCSYREMSAYCAAALMAHDMHLIVPLLSPASVTAFLREAVSLVPLNDSLQRRPISSLVSECRDSDRLAPLIAVGKSLTPLPEDRGTVMALLCHKRGFSAVTDNDVNKYCGIPQGVELTPAEWACWIFRELQALRSVSAKAVLIGHSRNT